MTQPRLSLSFSLSKPCPVPHLGVDVSTLIVRVVEDGDRPLVAMSVPRDDKVHAVLEEERLPDLTEAFTLDIVADESVVHGYVMHYNQPGVPVRRYLSKGLVSIALCDGSKAENVRVFSPPDPLFAVDPRNHLLKPLVLLAGVGVIVVLCESDEERSGQLGGVPGGTRNG